jgi:hypothetical protein
MAEHDNLLGTVIDGRYRLREFIGSGSFGSVYAADELTLGRVISQVAVKLITPESDEHRQLVLREILALAQLNHDYVITYRSSGEIREGPLAGTIFLATELGDTTLARLVRASERLPEEEFRELIRGVASALAHIHAAKAIHGDVKPANIIRVKGRWKLGDLGLMKSTKVKPTGRTHGSLTYMAPEMLRQDFMPANDVYALGVLIVNYFTGKYAHEGDNREEFADNLRSLPATVPEFIREPWRTLAARCLNRTPSERPTAEQVESTVRPGSPQFAHLDEQRRTFVVAPNGRGQFQNIQEAVEQAPSGSRILVHPGKYRETVRIDKSLEIVGEGPPDEIIITTRDIHCLEIATSKTVLVRGITMRVRPGTQGVDCYAVDIGQGKPVLKDCQIHSQTLACVAVYDGAEPTLRRCSMFGSRDAGVFVYDGGRGTFEACDIFSNSGTGVSVSDGGNAIFKRCRIYDNQAGGAAVFAGGEASFEECRLITNGKSGAIVAGAARFHQCRLTDNGAEGIVLKEGARARVIECDLRNNAKGPWKAPDFDYELEQSDNQE